MCPRAVYVKVFANILALESIIEITSSNGWVEGQVETGKGGRWEEGLFYSQLGGDHNVGVWKLSTGLLHHLPPEGFPFSTSSLPACGAAAFTQHFVTRKKLACVQEFPIRVSQQEHLWGFFFKLSGEKLGWAELAVCSCLCGCIRRCQGVVGLGGQDRDKAAVWDIDRESLCLCTCNFED